MHQRSPGQLRGTYSWPHGPWLGMSIKKFVRGLVRGHKSKTKERHGFLDLVFVRRTLPIMEKHKLSFETISLKSIAKLRIAGILAHTPEIQINSCLFVVL